SGVSPRTAGSVSATSSVAGTLASSATCSRLTSSLDSKKSPATSKNNDKAGSVTPTCSASGDTTSALLAATAAAVPVVSLSVTAIGSAPATPSVCVPDTVKLPLAPLTTPLEVLPSPQSMLAVKLPATLTTSLSVDCHSAPL